MELPLVQVNDNNRKGCGLGGQKYPRHILESKIVLADVFGMGGKVDVSMYVEILRWPFN